jgi:hypothetical protein
VELLTASGLYKLCGHATTILSSHPPDMFDLPSVFALRILFEVLGVAGVFFGSLLAIALFYIASSWVKAWTSGLSILPGPKPDSWIHGNYSKVDEFNSDRLREGWLKQFGRTIVVHSTLGVCTPYPWTGFSTHTVILGTQIGDGRLESSSAYFQQFGHLPAQARSPHFSWSSIWEWYVVRVSYTTSGVTLCHRNLVRRG